MHRIWRSPSTWFVIAAVLMIALGLFTAASRGDSALDIQIHDTYFVIVHTHLVAATAFFCLGCGVVYWTFSRVLHRPLNNGLGLLHTICTFIGLLGVYFPLHAVGLIRAPRRYYEYTEFTPMGGAGGIVNLNLTVTGFAVVFLIGQAVLILNIGRTLVKRPNT